MIIGLIILLLIIFILPLVFEKVESNLEIFLLIVGLFAGLISHTLTFHHVAIIFTNKFIYIITFAVLAGGLLFNHFRDYIVKGFMATTRKVSLKIIVFTLIVGLGLLSSFITAIIASLLLVEFVHFMPIERKDKIKITIIACYSIGIGAALTPIGEPLSTIIVSKLNTDFGYIFKLTGSYIVPCIIALGFIGAIFAKAEDKIEKEPDIVEESNIDIAIRALKIFVFIIALELLGEGFKPLIDTYILNLDSKLLYWVNILSAVLDNATMASAEISAKMNDGQIRAILMGLLISGGMMIPGNIPNIISASKLKIKSKEWMSFGIPLGILILILYFVIMFLF